jgi:RimJ/RimL family protein N-acetyltransferase
MPNIGVTFYYFFIKHLFISMFTLFSERIKIIPLTYKQLLLWAEDWLLLEQSLEVAHLAPEIDADYQGEIDDALKNYWLPKVKEAPENYLWLTAWQIIHLEKNVIIGGVGISPPDENGQAITGYHIDKRFQRQGFASEALRLILDWAFACNLDLKSVLATVHLGNHASHGVLLKNNFKEMKRDNELVYWQLTREIFYQ